MHLPCGLGTPIANLMFMMSPLHDAAMAILSNKSQTMPEGAEGKTSRLVIVDDYADAADTLAEILAADGHEVQVAHSGAEALSIIERELPLCVLTDIDMPGIDGLELARRLRERYGNDLVLIAVTAHADVDDFISARYKDFDHCLRKPLHLDELLTILRC